jgi:hypothetical protein
MRPTSRPEVKRIAMNVNSGTGVTPIAFKFHHLITQNVTSASASIIPHEMMIDNKLAIVPSFFMFKMMDLRRPIHV